MLNIKNIQNEVILADDRIRYYIRETPLDFSLPLSKITHSNVYLKCENLQYTGSFKVRGALNKLLSLSEAERLRGVVTASSGNHGAAIAYGLNKLNIPGVVFVPENASIAKVDNIKNYSIPLKFYATDCMLTEIHAIEYAKHHDMVYVSPYNDLQVIGGQGTIAVEIIKKIMPDMVLVPVGGGGLISGIAGYLKYFNPKIRVMGCLPSHSPVMAESVKARKIINMQTQPTLSDATAGGMEPGAITFDICQQLVDDFILVSEQEIQNAILSLINSHHLLIEGAAGVALASLLNNAERFQGKNVVVILSGANLSLDTLRNVLS